MRRGPEIHKTRCSKARPECNRCVLKLPHDLNILIAGRTGLGKSTLINAVFQKDLAETGQGRPVTKGTREITKEGVPITIFNARGLEMSEFGQTLTQLEKIIKERSGDRDSNRHIHVAWLCWQKSLQKTQMPTPTPPTSRTS